MLGLRSQEIWVGQISPGYSEPNTRKNTKTKIVRVGDPGTRALKKEHARLTPVRNDTRTESTQVFS